MARSYRNADPPLPIMQGVPVPEAWRVPAHDWDNPPWNRWSFQHMRQICPTIDVAAGAEIWAMPAQPADVDGIAYTDLDGNASTWAQMLELTYTDAALIWLDGRIIAESYFNGMTPRTQHLAFSVSKSVVSAAAGVLIGEGLMDPAAPVTDLMPELDATGWTGASLQHVLDMASGVVFDETYGNQDAHVFLLDVAAGVKPLYPWMDPETVPRTTLDLILSLTETDAAHGARFSYRSIETDLLGCLMERAAGQGLAEIVSTRLWAPMGAERDGFFTVDPAGFPLADGGFNATLRDFARFGRLLLEDGQRDGRQIIPKPWIEDIRHGSHGLANDDLKSFLPEGCYRNKFWIEDSTKGSHLSLGIFGQHIYVDPSIGLVAVKLSSWPDFLSDEGYLVEWLDAVKAVASAHGAKP